MLVEQSPGEGEGLKAGICVLDDITIFIIIDTLDDGAIDGVHDYPHGADVVAMIQ
ncbi:MAG: hypothetical protein OEZ32_12665 [Nitrospinota bacterium]|nr:hypothetical protein [Nitrospinota bacterium]